MKFILRSSPVYATHAGCHLYDHKMDSVDPDYIRERNKRLIKCKKISQYIEYVNKKNKLLDSFDIFKEQNDISHNISKNYSPMPLFIASELVKINKDIYTHVINMLPYSKSFVASLSYINNVGWILWDIYGSWYRR